MRDKIYGLLSIAPPQIAARVKPNYKLPPREVYMDFFIILLDVTKRLDFLSMCASDDSDDGTAQLPSWVPNLSAPLRVSGYDMFQAAALSRSEHSQVQPGQLNVTGVLHAQIVGVSDPISTDTLEVAQLLLKHLPIGLSKSAFQRSGSLLDTWLRLLSLDRIRDRRPDCQQLPTLQMLRKIWTDSSIEDHVPLELLMIGVTEVLRDQVLLKLDNGCLGFGPPTTQSGDCAVVMLGSYAPMVLRSRKDGKYTVLGECYVQNLMNGEALLGDLPRHCIAQQLKSGMSYIFKYYDSATQTLMDDDPRLPPLDENWKRVHRERTDDDPLYVDWFEYIPTGEVINSDPRLFPDALRSRGVPLQTFELV